MDGLPPATPEPELDHVCRKPGPEGLRARDNAGLIPSHVAQSRRKLTVHAHIVTASADIKENAQILGEGLGSGEAFVHSGPKKLPQAQILPGN
jgi:hypothetical protein